MSKKLTTERETQELFDLLRRRAEEDHQLFEMLKRFEDVEALMGDDGVSEPERFKLPYSSAPDIKAEEIWN
jgi:hypothetical protein